MTPTLHALARQYLALPGAPQVPPDLRNEEAAAIGRGRGRDGIEWVFVPEAGNEEHGAGEWLIDLTDDATGGVMTGRLRRGGIWLAEKRVSVTGGAQPTWGYWLEGGRDHYIAECDYQGEFAARVAVAAGRAG